MADSGWVLPDKYDKDLKDENGNPLSKSEFKKRQKAAEKAKKAAEKAAAKAAKPQPTKKKQVGPPRQMCAWTGSIPRPKIQTSPSSFRTRLVASTLVKRWRLYRRMCSLYWFSRLIAPPPPPGQRR